MRLSSDSRSRERKIQNLEQRLADQERQSFEATEAKDSEFEERILHMTDEAKRLAGETEELKRRLEEKEQESNDLRSKMKNNELSVNDA